MTQKMKQALLNAIKRQGWEYTEDVDDGSIDIRKMSPGGDEVTYRLPGKNIMKEVQEIYLDFDPEEYASERIKADVMLSARAVIEDADEIDDMLMQLSNALVDAEALNKMGKEEKKIEEDIQKGIAKKHALDALTEFCQSQATGWQNPFACLEAFVPEDDVETNKSLEDMKNAFIEDYNDPVNSNAARLAAVEKVYYKLMYEVVAQTFMKGYSREEALVFVNLLGSHHRFPWMDIKLFPDFAVSNNGLAGAWNKTHPDEEPIHVYGIQNHSDERFLAAFEKAAKVLKEELDKEPGTPNLAKYQSEHGEEAPGRDRENQR